MYVGCIARAQTTHERTKLMGGDNNASHTRLCLLPCKFFMLSVEGRTFASFLKRPEDEAKSIKSLHFGVLHTFPRTL